MTEQRKSRGSIDWRPLLRASIPFWPLVIVLVGYLWGARVDFANGAYYVNFPGGPPCHQPLDSPCLLPNSKVASRYTNADVCAVPGRVICLVPIGAVTDETISGIAREMHESYDIDVRVLPPIAVPESAYNVERRQFTSEKLMDAMVASYPNEYEDGSLILGVTPVDMYLDFRTRWRYAFGMRRTTPSGATIAAISTYRMNFEEFFVVGRVVPVAVTYGYDSERRDERVLKLATKYVGLSHFGLPGSDDPKSVLFNNILSPSDLDRMSDKLPER